MTQDQIISLAAQIRELFRPFEDECFPLLIIRYKENGVERIGTFAASKSDDFIIDTLELAITQVQLHPTDVLETFT